MRITRDSLLKLARDTAAQRARRSRDILCIYLTGSLLSEEPLLGGTTDIDLIMVHNSEPPLRREVVGLTDEISLDIGHVPAEEFDQPRRLRTDPWLGSYLCENPMVLHDTRHWFEFIQASACAQFYLPEYVAERARPLAAAARQGWLALHRGELPPGPRPFIEYLDVIQQAGNALALLSGPPLPLRRFFLELPARAEAVQQPDLAAGMAGLIWGQASPAGFDWEKYIAPWLAGLKDAARADSAPARLQPARDPYYVRAARELAEPSPDAALWILLRTWTDAVCQVGDDAPSRAGWEELLQTLGLTPGTPAFGERLAQTDAVLDRLEETLDEWEQSNGIGL